MTGDQLFIRLARAVSRFTGRSLSFVLALGVVLAWLFTGPLFHFSDTWQLVINTATTIVTFLMVFLIQNTQNRETEAMQIKLDELIRVSRDAHNALPDLEELGDREIDAFRARYRAGAAGAAGARARRGHRRGLGRYRPGTRVSRGRSGGQARRRWPASSPARRRRTAAASRGGVGQSP